MSEERNYFEIDKTFNKDFFDNDKNYNYVQVLRNDILQFLAENKLEIDDENKAEMIVKFQLEDSITGAASGSYFCNSYKAARALSDYKDKFYDYASRYFSDEEIAEMWFFKSEAADVLFRQCLIEELFGDEYWHLFLGK